MSENWKKIQRDKDYPDAKSLKQLLKRTDFSPVNTEVKKSGRKRA